MSLALIFIRDQKESTRLRQILQSGGYEPIEAEDDVMLRTLLAKKSPELVVAEIAAGESFFEDIFRVSPDIPVIGWMPGYEPRSAVRIMRAGVFDCISSPLEHQETLEVVAHTLEHYHRTPAKKKLSPVYYAALRFGRMFLYGLSIILLLFLAEVFMPKDPKLETVRLPYQHPTALAWDGKCLWISNWYTQSIYRYERIERDLQLTGTYYFGDYGPVGVARAGKYLWSAGNDLVLRRHSLSDNLEVSADFPFPEYTISGMAGAENVLWIADTYQRKLYKYAAGDVVSLMYTYQSPLFSLVGLCFDKDSLWMADAKTERVYVYKQSGRELKLSAIYQLPVLKVDGQLAGIAREDKWLHVAYAGKDAQLVRYSIKDLKLIKEKGREYLAPLQPGSGQQTGASKLQVINIR